MLKLGLIGLAMAAGCALLLALLIAVGVAHFGPCGPDAIGLVFLFGFLSTGIIGSAVTFAGLLQFGFRMFRH